MKNDPVIEAVREVRHRISESVGHDPHRLVAYYRQLQERRGNHSRHQQLGSTGVRAPQREGAGQCEGLPRENLCAR